MLGLHMKQFTLRLCEKYANPVLVLEDFYKLLALADTGASIPVIMFPEEIVISLGGKLKQKNVNVKGLAHQSNF